MTRPYSNDLRERITRPIRWRSVSRPPKRLRAPSWRTRVFTTA